MEEGRLLQAFRAFVEEHPLDGLSKEELLLLAHDASELVYCISKKLGDGIEQIIDTRYQKKRRRLHDDDNVDIVCSGKYWMSDVDIEKYIKDTDPAFDPDCTSTDIRYKGPLTHENDETSWRRICQKCKRFYKKYNE